MKQAAGNLLSLEPETAQSICHSVSTEALPMSSWNMPNSRRIDGIWFKDHWDGSNRPKKFKRDIVLLEEVLRTETNEGLLQRAHFYLGQSYFDSGNWHKAAFHYHNRTAMGGFQRKCGLSSSMHIVLITCTTSQDSGRRCTFINCGLIGLNLFITWPNSS